MKRYFLFFLLLQVSSTINTFLLKSDIFPIVGCSLPLLFDVASKCKKNYNVNKSLFSRSTPQFVSGTATSLTFLGLYYACKKGYLNHNISLSKKLGLTFCAFAAPVIINTLTKITANYNEGNEKGKMNKKLSTDLEKHVYRGLVTGTLAACTLFTSLSLVPTSNYDSKTDTRVIGFSLFGIKYHG